MGGYGASPGQGRAFCVSAMGGGGGKTLLSLALCRAFSRKGMIVQPFKKGPDYIDSAWLGLASGRKAINLDPFFLPPASLRTHFSNALGRAARQGRQILGIVEGNRGLYDGLDAQGSCSTANVARALNIPVLLCVNCEKTTRTMAALLKGLTTFEQGLKFCGVVLNRVGSPRHERALREIISGETDLAVLGALPRLHANPLPERHMGIASHGPDLCANAAEQLDRLADLVLERCDLEAILHTAATLAIASPDKDLADRRPPGTKPVIGYVEDAALWFYYPENLEALETAGANLRKLRLDAPEDTWRGISGLYLGGGFPEDFAQAISCSPRLGLIREFAEGGMPVYAECGGLILLCRGLQLAGKFWPMANIFPSCVHWQTKPRGLGYVEARVGRANPFFQTGERLKGHEFHYSACSWENSSPVCALRLERGAGVWQDENGIGHDGLVWKNVWGSYMHIFAPVVPSWAPAFVSLARLFMSGHTARQDSLPESQSRPNRWLSPEE